MIYNAIGLQLDTTDAMTSLSARPDFSANLANIRHMARAVPSAEASTA